MNRRIENYLKQHNEAFSQYNSGLISAAEFLIFVQSEASRQLVKERDALIAEHKMVSANIELIESVLVPQ